MILWSENWSLGLGGSESELVGSWGPLCGLVGLELGDCGSVQSQKKFGDPLDGEKKSDPVEENPKLLRSFSFSTSLILKTLSIFGLIFWFLPMYF